jgi:hypothetical protein
MTDERAEVQVRLIGEETEADDRRAVNAREVMVVGLVAGMLDLAELMRGERMDDACFIAGVSKGALHGLMIVAGAFHGDEDLGESMRCDGIPERIDRLAKRGSGVLDRERVDARQVLPALGLDPDVHHTTGLGSIAWRTTLDRPGTRGKRLRHETTS